MKREVIEYTCDVCGCEVDEGILIPSQVETGAYNVTLTSGMDICIYCFIKAVDKLDLRAKAANNE